MLCSTVANLPEAVESKSNITSENHEPEDGIKATVGVVRSISETESNLSDSTAPSTPSTSTTTTSKGEGDTYLFTYYSLISEWYVYVRIKYVCVYMWGVASSMNESERQCGGMLVYCTYTLPFLCHLLIRFITPSIKRRKIDPDAIELEILKQLASTKNSVPTTGDDDDEDYAYGRTVALSLKKLKPHLKAQAKIKIQQLLYDLEFPQQFHSESVEPGQTVTHSRYEPTYFPHGSY